MFRPGGGPARASASTTCQKCLKKGHYSYECTSQAQERPYVSRPSRTQMLADPKLLPKLNSHVPPAELLRKEGLADELLAEKQLERGRKRDRDEDGTEADDIGMKRQRSLSSSMSVATISTKFSRSRSRSPNFTGGKASSNRGGAKRRHSFSSSRDSYSSGEHLRGPRSGSRSTRRRISDQSPPRPRGRRRSPRVGPRNDRSNSRSPQHSKKGIEKARVDMVDSAAPCRANLHPSSRKRSLSPFSRRLALTKSMANGG